MQNIVVTGSTRGIGFGLAQAFLAQGHRVAIVGRSQASVDSAMATLCEQFSTDLLLAQACDVGNPAQVLALWKAANARWGRVDIWINNAGVTNASKPFWELETSDYERVVRTNLLGIMFSAQTVIRGMQAQGAGHLYNMEGLGSDGSSIKGLVLYGTTKRALRYLTRALAKELRGSPVKVSALSPGMVVTDLLVGDYADRPDEFERVKKFFNILADDVDTVAPWLAARVLANTKNGARIAWLTGPKIAWRFASSPFRRRDLFAERPEATP